MNLEDDLEPKYRDGGKNVIDTAELVQNLPVRPVFRRVVALRMAGYSQKEIGDAVGKSESWVSQCLRQVCREVGPLIRNLVEAA